MSGIGISEPSPLRGGSDGGSLFGSGAPICVPQGGVTVGRRGVYEAEGITCAWRSATGTRLGARDKYTGRHDDGQGR